MLVTGAVGAIVAAYAAVSVNEFSRLDRQVDDYKSRYEEVFKPESVTTGLTGDTWKDHFKKPYDSKTFTERLTQVRTLSQDVEELLKGYASVETWALSPLQPSKSKNSKKYVKSCDAALKLIAHYLFQQEKL